MQEFVLIVILKILSKTGTTKTRKKQYFCKNCHKRFIEFYSYKAYDKKIKPLMKASRESLFRQ